MSKTFGELLQNFVLSVDIVDNITRDTILAQIKSYLNQELGIIFIIFHIETEVDQQPGLSTSEWHTGGKKLSITIKDAKDIYKAQVALAFDIDQPLWIVGDKQEVLSNSEKFQDLWSNTDSKVIPNYYKNTDNSNVHTSIIIPANNNKGKKFGVVNFESELYLEPSPSYQKELSLIVKSLSKLYSRNQNFAEQTVDTREAVQELINLKDAGLKALSKPKIFLASSSRAEEDVMGLIIEVINEMEIFEYEYWSDVSTTGTINDDIVDKIKLCKYGICYLSERKPDHKKTDNDPISYVDNPNVLIESGMIIIQSEKSDNLIPIREEASPPMPFDIRQIRTITVKRNTKHQINKDSFKNNLRNYLKSWAN